MEACKIANMYDLSQSIAGDYLSGFIYPWEALDGIGDYIRKLGPTLDPEKYEQRGEDIWVAKSATVAPTACLNGPLIIDENAEILKELDEEDRKKAKKEAKKTEKNGVPPSPNNKPPEEVPVIVPSSASEPNVTTPSVIESTNETNPSIEQSTSEEVFNNTEIIEPISHVVREVTDNDIETSSEETDERRSERSRRGEEDDDYYEPIDEFAVIKVEKVNRAFLSKIKFNSKEIEMKDEPFSYAYSLVVFLVVLALVILGLQLLFGNSKKQGDYLLIDENPNINEFSLQYSK